MSSLADTYNGSPVGALWSRRQLILGISVFVVGVIMSIGAIVAASTEVLVQMFELNVAETWEIAGILGGVGVPLIFTGVFVVLPSSPKLRVTGASGLAIAFIGTYLFSQNFPLQWYGDTVNNAPLVLAVYAMGFGLTFWCLFSAVVGFKTRNRPGGTVSLKMVIQGRERVVEVSRDDFEKGLTGSGGVGILGNPSTEYVETQTAEKSENAQRSQPTSKQETTQRPTQTTSQQNTEFDTDGSPSMRDAELLSDD